MLWWIALSEDNHWFLLTVQSSRKWLLWRLQPRFHRASLEYSLRHDCEGYQARVRSCRPLDIDYSRCTRVRRRWPGCQRAPTPAQSTLWTFPHLLCTLSIQWYLGRDGSPCRSWHWWRHLWIAWETQGKSLSKGMASGCGYRSGSPNPTDTWSRSIPRKWRPRN